MDVSISLALLWYQNQQYYYTDPMKYDVILVTRYSQLAEQRKKHPFWAELHFAA